jgi:hypothetical protein
MGLLNALFYIPDIISTLAHTRLKFNVLKILKFAMYQKKKQGRSSRVRHCARPLLDTLFHTPGSISILIRLSSKFHDFLEIIQLARQIKDGRVMNEIVSHRFSTRCFVFLLPLRGLLS